MIIIFVFQRMLYIYDRKGQLVEELYVFDNRTDISDSEAIHSVLVVKLINTCNTNALHV